MNAVDGDGGAADAIDDVRALVSWSASRGARGSGLTVSLDGGGDAGRGRGTREGGCCMHRVVVLRACGGTSE